MNKLLTATVSWQRPALCKKMIKSFLKTKSIAILFIYICEDDPYVEEYKKLIKEFPDVMFAIGPHLYIAEVSNHICKNFNSEYYQMVNDDHLFVEKGWDTEMIEALDKCGGWRIAACYMPEEMMVGDKTALGPSEPSEHFVPINAPTAEIFSRKIINVLGFYNVPGFKQYGCDGYIMELGEDLGGIIPFCGKILHNCWHGLNRMKLDKTARETYFEKHIHSGNGYTFWQRIRPIMKLRFKEAKEREAMEKKNER